MAMSCAAGSRNPRASGRIDHTHIVSMKIFKASITLKNPLKPLMSIPFPSFHL